MMPLLVETGNDSLLGNWGNDTYYFYRGDGQDVIHDFQLYNGVVYDGGNDTLVFGNGIVLSDFGCFYKRFRPSDRNLRGD